jgi:hypothetical protein
MSKLAGRRQKYFLSPGRYGYGRRERCKERLTGRRSQYI